MSAAGPMAAGRSTAALLAVLWVTGAAVAQAPAGEAGWFPIFDFALEIDGKPAPDARFFVEARGPRLLVRDPALASAAIIDRSTKIVTAVSRDKVALDPDSDTVEMADGVAEGAPTTKFTINSAEVVFYLGSSRLKILPKNPLVGPATLDEILRHSPLYKSGIEVYEPDEGPIAAIRSFRRPVDIEVYFGTWCSHCKVLVPKFVKVMQAADNPNLKVTWTGVPKVFSSYPPAQGKGIRGIPTFIFHRDGKEVGRIPGDPGEASIEKAIADILRTIEG